MTMTVGEALEHRRIILDALEECRLAQAIWLASQNEGAISLARSFMSLVGDPLHMLWGEDLVITPRGLRSLRRFGRNRAASARDNRRAIQAAIDQAAAGGGGGIHIPRGTYEIS